MNQGTTSSRARLRSASNAAFISSSSNSLSWEAVGVSTESNSLSWRSNFLGGRGGSDEEEEPNILGPCERGCDSHGVTEHAMAFPDWVRARRACFKSADLNIAFLSYTTFSFLHTPLSVSILSPKLWQLNYYLPENFASTYLPTLVLSDYSTTRVLALEPVSYLLSNLLWYERTFEQL